MKAFIYDEKTKEFIGEIEAQLDPLESKKANKEIWILPANSTFNEPVNEKDGFKIKWSGSEWIYEEIKTEKEDRREKKKEEKEKEIRAIRNFYLFDTDKFLSVPDFPVTEGEKAQYLEYRKYLRDYPEKENWYEQPPMTFKEWRGK